MLLEKLMGPEGKSSIILCNDDTARNRKRELTAHLPFLPDSHGYTNRESALHRPQGLP